MNKKSTVVYSLGILFFIFSLTSCVSKKEISYFQNDVIDQSKVNNNYETKFKPDDLLQITVMSQDIEAAIPFNLPTVSFGASMNTAVGTPQQQSYLIDSDGNIDFPVIGKLKLGGLTRTQGISLIRNKLSPDYLKNPTINIRISNFKVTVLGEVNKPGSYIVTNERITILEALGLAGDLTIYGLRNNIKVTREENGEKKIYTLNLLSKNIFISPVYYLEQNDLIYVEPNYSKAQDSAYIRNTGLFISLGSVIISLITILTR